MLHHSPYMTVTDEEGAFELDKLPVGQWTFRFWHERKGWLKQVRIGRQMTDDAGRIRLTIRSGRNRLSTEPISLKP